MMNAFLLILPVLAGSSALPAEDQETIAILTTLATKKSDTNDAGVDRTVIDQEQQEQLDYLYELFHSQFTNDKPQPDSTNNQLFAQSCDCPSPKAPPGAVYIRWGRDVCPSTATKIYSGLAAGSGFTVTGGAAEYLCLPETPIYNRPLTGIQDRTSGLYGVEYRNDFPPLESVVNHDVTCVVCEASGRSSVLMVPARTSCPVEWTREYYGYLTTERGAHHYRTRYVCLDGNPTPRAGTAAPATPHFYAAMQPVEGRCTNEGGGLPCGPYVDGYELTCAVCTK